VYKIHDFKPDSKTSTNFKKLNQVFRNTSSKFRLSTFPKNL